MPLENRTLLITGGARRIGRHLAIAAAKAGADIILHHANSPEQAEVVADEIRALGRNVWVYQADFSNLEQTYPIVDTIWNSHPFDMLINNAAIFSPLDWQSTTPDAWQNHLNINLTAPFFLSQSFARHLGKEALGKIINILDWRALRPADDHLPYTVSKAALAALTKSLAIALAPNICVNAIALGAILPPSDGAVHDKILQSVPAARWAELDEVSQTMLFLLTGPAYITGEIIHVDGGRHLI